MTAEQWLDRKPFPWPEPRMDFSDFPNHHYAVIRCLDCAGEFSALYPQKANTAQLQCPRCLAQNSEVAKYIKFIGVQ